MSLGSQRPMMLYGNCQAGAIASTLRVDSVVSSFYAVEYHRSFDHPTEGAPRFDAASARSCALLWEQHDPQGYPGGEMLPADCLRITFPAADLNLLWPFNCVNRYNAPEPPDFPFGRYPYGDRVILNAVERGLSPDDVLDYYLNRWDEYKIDLCRLLELETSRIRAREARCGVKIGDFVLGRFRKERLFWTVDHPTPVLLTELAERLLQSSDPVQPALADADFAGTLRAHFPLEGPLGVVDVPIHPKVAEHLRLEWYDPGVRHRSWDGKTYSHVEYLEGMIRQAMRMREEGAGVSTQSE